MKDAAPLLTAQHHAVRFYENDKSLAQIVAQFLSDGLAAGNPGIVVATPAHRAAILRELVATSLDVVQLQRSNDLVLLDAQETLSIFMTNGKPRPRHSRTACVKSSKRRAAGDRIAPSEYMARWWTFSGRTVSKRRRSALKCSGINWQIRRRFRFYVGTRWGTSTRTRISKKSVATTRMLFL